MKALLTCWLLLVATAIGQAPRTATTVLPNRSTPVLTTAVSPIALPHYTQEILADGPIFYAPLTETAPSGSNSVLDRIASYHGTPTGTPDWTYPGPLGRLNQTAPKFDGASNYVSFPGTLATAFLNTGAWSVECYYSTAITTGAGGTLLGAAHNASNRVALEVYNNRLLAVATVGGVAFPASTVNPQAAAWNHVVFTSTGKLYVNGRPETGASGATPANTNTFVVGARNGASSFFNGTVSHVSVFPTVLTPARVQAHYVAGSWLPVRTDAQIFGYGFENSGPPELLRGGADFSGQLDQGATISSALFHDGAASLALGGGTFRSCTFDNPTPFNKFCDQSRGTANGWFYYSGGTASGMLWQVGSKDRTGWNDFNEGYKLTFSSTGAIFRADTLGSTTSTQVSLNSFPISAGSWHWFEVKWDRFGATTMSITIDSTTNTTSLPIDGFRTQAFHHLLLGNDTVGNNTLLYLDTFKLYGSWLP